MKKHANDFKGAEGLVAYIVTPDRSNKALTGSPNYRAKIPSMRSTVATILGITDDKVKIQTYIPVDKKKDESGSLDKTAAGHMIFDFDPTGGSKREPYAWRLIWQNSQIDADQWSPPSV